MLAKRIALVVLALIIGFVATEFIIWFYETTREIYWDAQGVPYYPLTIIFTALGTGLWLDKWMGTELLTE